MPKKLETIDLEKRNGVFVPVRKTVTSTKARHKTLKRNVAPRNRLSLKNPLESIVEGIVTDFFSAIRQKMFR